MINKDGIENRLKKMAEKKSQQITTSSDLVDHLLPQIEKWSDDGFTLKEICEAINAENPRFKMTYQTFKTYLSAARKKAGQKNE